MSSVELIDLQRYWWHLYVERLDSFEGREVNPPETNYLPELRPTAWEKGFASSSNSLLWDNCYIKPYPTPTPCVHSCWPKFLTGLLLIYLHPDAGPLCSGDAWRIILKDTDGFCGAMSFIRNKRECASVFTVTIFSSVQFSW